jgi:hypothetical protein
MEEIREVIALGSDPMSEAWLSPEAREASAALLEPSGDR